MTVKLPGKGTKIQRSQGGRELNKTVGMKREERYFGKKNSK
jgi:hypothetical protein